MKQAIIILNQGDAWFLKYTLHQARASSPDVPIFLLGDSANHKYNGTAEHHLISDYADAAGPFSAVYEHMSSNARWIELLCFQRWFIINRFVAAKGIERCLYLDTDAMLYADARAELDRLSGCDLALCGASGPSTLYFQNAKTLDALANFIYKTYAEPAGIAQLRTRFETYRATGRPGGICDMTLLGDFVRTGQARHGDLLEIRDNSVYDDNINSSDGFETAGGRKRIQWIDGQPHGHHLASDRMIRFKSLHFQGAAKPWIGRAFTGPGGRGSAFGAACDRVAVLQSRLKNATRIIAQKLGGRTQ